MKTNSKKLKEDKSIIEEKLKRISLSKLSKESGFCKRKPKKIEPKKLLLAFLLTIVGSKKNTYSSWASKLGLLINDTVSKQAICKRITESLVKFLQSVLKAIMEESLNVKIQEKSCEQLKQFKRILLEDSTTIKLNDKMSKEYPGNKNQMAKEHAIMKIQTTYDLLKRRFLRFEITNFRKNDQGYSTKILEIAKPGDLIIRDLGYFVLRVFKKLTQEGVYFISRLKKGVKIFTIEEGKPIDLAKMLSKRGNLDIEVFIGEREKLPVRLVALHVTEETASERRRKARANRDRRCSPSKEHLFLLGWDIFITSVSKDKLTSSDIVKIYSIRWRIEIIFKCWKSHLEITNIPNDANKIRLESFIHCMLIFILLFQVHFYNYYLSRLSNRQLEHHNQVSMMKLIQFLSSNISLILYVYYFKNIDWDNLLCRHISYYCTYETRKDRMNYNQLLLKLS